MPKMSYYLFGLFSGIQKICFLFGNFQIDLLKKTTNAIIKITKNLFILKIFKIFFNKNKKLNLFYKFFNVLMK